MTILFDLYHSSEPIGYVDLSHEMPYMLTISVATPQNNFTHLNLAISPLMQILGLPYHWIMIRHADGSQLIDESQTFTTAPPPERRIYSFLQSLQAKKGQEKIFFPPERSGQFIIKVESPPLLFQGLIQLLQHTDFLKQVLAKNTYKIIPRSSATSSSVEPPSFTEIINKILPSILKRSSQEILTSLHPEISEHWKVLFEIIKTPPIDEYPFPKPHIFIKSLQLPEIKKSLLSKTLSNLNLFSLWGIKYYEHGYNADTQDSLQTQKKEALIGICLKIDQASDILKIDDILPRDDNFTSGSFSRIRELCLRHLAHEFYTNQIENRYNILCQKAAAQEYQLKSQHLGDTSKFYADWEELYSESIQLLKALEDLKEFAPPPSIETFNYQKISPPAWEPPSNPEAIEALRQANLRLPQTNFETAIATVAAPLTYVYNALPTLPPALASIPTPTSAVNFLANWWYSPPKPYS